jgi:uncharacterized protein (TIGR02246 family)
MYVDWTRICFLSLAMLFSSVSYAAPQPSKARAEIEAADKQITQAVKAGDAVAMAALYSEDAMLLPPGEDFVRGIQKIQDYWHYAFEKGGVKQMDLAILEVYSYGNEVAELGTYVVMNSKGEKVDVGKYIVLWRKEQNRWKLHRDSWSSNAPVK